jgi:hypothetical protein
MKNILQGIGIVFTLIASFLGLMYTLKGDVLISSLVSLVIIVIEYFLIEKFIKSKSEITKNKFSTLSIVLWSVYIILAIPISIFLLHALNVEINAKSEIQKVANAKINDLTNMSTAYRTTVDKNVTTLSILLDTKLTQYAYGNYKLGSELKSSPYNISENELDLLDRSNVGTLVSTFTQAKSIKLLSPVDSIDTKNKNFIARYGGVFDGWSRLHLNYAFYELDNLLVDNYQSLVNFDSQNMGFVPTRFTYTYSVEETNMDKPFELFNKHKPYNLILVVLLFHLLILLPYFIEPESGKYIKNKGTRQGGGLKI